MTLGNKTSYFGCENFLASLHCDLQNNGIVGFDIPQKSKLINNITREPIYVNNKAGKAISLIDRYSESIEIPKKKIYQLPNFSVSFWIKKPNGTSQLNEHAHIISFTSFDKRKGWYFDTNSSKDQSVRFIISNNEGNLTISDAVPISNSTFTQITTTFDGKQISIYKNDNIFQSIRYNGNYSGDPDLSIHIGSASYCVSCLQFNGLIDNVKLFDKALSQDDVKELYFENNHSIINDAKNIEKDLIGNWPFDGTLKDFSSTNNSAQMLTLLTSMVTSPDGRIFISEKNTGKVVIMKDEKLLKKPFTIINDSYVDWEQGLLGLALDPKFNNNHFLYLYYTAINSNGDPINRIVRFTDKDNTGVNMTVILDNIPASHGYHSGGAMAFGPDNKLYVTVGDATEHLYAQSPSVNIGKVLRIESNGSIPTDNPFPNSPVYTLGHRNMFGIAFDNKENIGIVTENGDALYDEINLLKKGGNYGFPTLQPANINPFLSNSTIDIKPLRTYLETPGPTQAIFYLGKLFPSLKNTFLYGTFNGKIYGIYINNKTKTIDYEIHLKLNRYPFEPVIGMTQTRDGNIYYGSYHIYKLSSIYVDNAKQTLFPLRLDYSKNMILDDIQINLSKNLVIILHSNVDPKRSNFSNEFVKIQIPKSIINDIENVTKSENLSTKNFSSVINHPFALKSDLQYNNITIPLKNDEGKKMKITINNRYPQ